VVSQGSSHRLTQRLIRDVGHCSFTMAELASAFDDLVAWAEGGQKPYGDDILDTRLWSRTDVGCQSTNNTRGAGDRADLEQRAKIQAKYPPCPAR